MSIVLSGEGATYISGITHTAYNTSTITNNINNGNLQANNRAGGIVGYTDSTTTTALIQGNLNYGSITTVNAGSAYTGGIIGILNAVAKPTITNNTNYGVITSYSTTYPACGIASGTSQNTGFTHRAKQCNLILHLLYSTFAKFRLCKTSSAFPTSRF